MRRRSENIEMLAVVAKGLRGLKDKVAFVGGATIDLYVTDPAAPEVRPTDDVDCVVELASTREYHEIEEELRGLGFKHALGDGPICRWEFSGIQVDVMPTEGKVLGFKNRWYADGMAHAQTHALPDGQKIKAFSVPYLLASKIEAFHDRGDGDYRSSSDLEDIVALLDGCPDAKEHILQAPENVRKYLAREFKNFLEDDSFLESLSGHIPDPGSPQERVPRVEALLRELADYD